MSVENKILGPDVVFSVLVDDEYIPVFCAKTVSLQKSFDEIECTSVNSPNAREYRPGLSNAILSASGVSSIESDDPDGDRLSFFYLNQLADTRVMQSMRLAFLAQGGNAIAYLFSGFFRDLSIDGNVGQWSQSSCTARISGDLEPTTDLEPPTPAGFELLGDWWQTSNGDNFIDGASATPGKNYTLQTTDVVKQVDVEGLNYDIVSGTPGNRQCQLDLANNKIIIGNTVFDGTQTVFVLFERPV